MDTLIEGLEVNMDDMHQGDMQQANMQRSDGNRFMHNAFWLDDRISVTFTITVPPGGQFPITEVINQGLNARMQAINTALSNIGFSVNFFSNEDGKGGGQSVPSDIREGNDSGKLPTGVYLFRPPLPVPGGAPEAVTAK